MADQVVARRRCADGGSPPVDIGARGVLGRGTPVSGSYEEGRLDEQGVAEHESVHPEVAGQGRDELRPSDKVTAWLESRGVLRWVHRHQRRLSIAVLAGLLVAGTAATWWVTRPPVESVSLKAGLAVRQSSSGSTGVMIDGDELRQSFQLSTDVAGERLVALGIIGPGLVGEVSDQRDAVTEQQALTVSLGARLDCADGRWRTATPEDYRIVIRRTDAWDRQRRFELALDAQVGFGLGETGPPIRADALWLSAVRALCRG
jgi:hypothetical protein